MASNQEFARILNSERDNVINGDVKIGNSTILHFHNSKFYLDKPVWELLQQDFAGLTGPISNAVRGQDIAEIEFTNVQLIRDKEELQPEVSIEGENFLQRLQMKLEELYRDRQLPYPPLLGCDPNVAVDGGYIDPLMKCKNSNESILVHEVFKNLERKGFSLLSIEADPGNGKSALAQKLINDWSRKREYINHFHLAFLLDGDIKSKNITEAISDIIKNAVSYNIQKVASEKILMNKDIKILLIFDELDENSDVLTTSLSRDYSHITKIVTCKRDFQLKPNISHWRIELFGIRSQQNENFLQKFKTRGQVKNVLRFCGNSMPSNLCVSSPLHLAVLSTLSEKIGCMTETEAFRKVFNTIAQIRLRKMGKPSEDFDLFSLSALRKSIQTIGELTIKKGIQSSLNFVQKSAIEEMNSLGFLTKVGHTLVTYDYNLLELSAAYSVAVHYKITKDRNQLLENVSKYFNLKEHSLFISFLVTLLPENAIASLCQMEFISPWLALNESNLFLILSNYEGEDLKRIIEATKSSIPPHVQVDSENFQKLPIATQRELLVVGLEEERITMISITNKEKLLIFENLPMTNVKLIVTIFPCQNFNNLYHLKRIQCKKLVFEFADGAKDCLSLYFCLFSSISAQIYELRLLGPQLHEELIDSIRFLKKTIHHLHTKLTTEAETYSIKTLIQNNQVESIKLDKQLKVDLKDILVAIAESNETKSLDLTYPDHVEENSIDLMQLTKNENKKYTNLSFKNCRLTCQQNLSTKLESRFDFIAMKDQIEENTLILKATNPRWLQRPVNMMKNLSGSWIDSLQSLTLLVNEHDPSLWIFLSEFCSNMETLVLLFEVHELAHKEAIAIVECIEKIKIKYLAVGETPRELSHNVGQTEFAHTVELLINYFNVLPISSVETLDVHIMFGKCNCDRCPRAIDSALNAVHDNRVKIVNMFCHEEAVKRHVLGNDILRGLSVSHQVEEVCESHWQELGTDVKYLNHFKIEKP